MVCSVIFVNETKTRTKMIRQSFTKTRTRNKSRTKCEIMSRQQRACTEAERHTDRDRHRDTERRGRSTAKRREEMKAVCRMKGRDSRKKCQEKAPSMGKVRGRRQREWTISPLH